MYPSLKSFVATAVIAAAAASTGALAADVPVKAPAKAAPVVSPATNWTGFYVGAGVGYTWGNVDVGTGGNQNASNLDPNGFLVVINAGYDYQFANNLVLGARLAVPVIGVDETIFSPIAGGQIRAETSAAVVLVGRAGIAFSRYLPYVFAGGVWARGEATRVGIGTVKEDHSGVIVGLGLETMLTRNWSLDINYSYVDMSTETYNFTPFGGGLQNYGYDSSTVTVTGNYRF